MTDANAGAKAGVGRLDPASVPSGPVTAAFGVATITANEPAAAAPAVATVVKPGTLASVKVWLEYAWPVLGLAAAVFAGWLLFKELRGLRFGDIVTGLEAIPPHRFALSILSTFVAYAALAWYDRIALLHLGRHLGWGFISLVSFTTYALSHNIGASVFSGAMVRYRAYSTKGLDLPEIGLLVAFCSFTFALGTVFLMGVVLVIEPQIAERLVGVSARFDLSTVAARGVGAVMLAAVGVYVLGSALNLKPLRLGSFRLEYPHLGIAARQLVAAPLELLGAAAIIHFALPEAGHPGFLVVLGVFLASFSAALLSHAPGGMGVLEYVFITAMPGMDKAGVLAALIVFRLFYLLIPLGFALVVVVLFERRRLARKLGAEAVVPRPGPGMPVPPKATR